MNHVIVGTAGHVDHGKTCLIRALTGLETDRLKEEKQRGITIELGFANLPNDQGQSIGIIDVPGHERFIKHMLAGIGGIDLVLLVVAADEGVMPQTVEHFEILKMLHINKGIVVITKKDMVDEEWLEVVMDDVSETVKGTFLEGAPMVAVSSHTGEGIPELKQLICDMVRDCGGRREDPSLFRLPIDRVFTMEGFGTVITGTLMEGSVKVGDEVELYPSEKKAKVRSIQVHGQSVDRAAAGQRTAMNLTGIKKEEIKRGEVLAAKDSLECTMMLDVNIEMFADSPRTLLNDSRLHLYYGSAEALCKAVLLDAEVLEAGQTGLAQLRLEEKVAVRKGDRFILRFYSPLESIGGGVIIDAHPPKRKRFKKDVIKALEIKSGDQQELVLEQVLKECSQKLGPVSAVAGSMGWTMEETQKGLDELLAQGKALVLDKNLILHADYLADARSQAMAILEQHRKENPALLGMNKEEFRKRLLRKLRLEGEKNADLLWNRILTGEEILDRGNIVADRKAAEAPIPTELLELHKRLNELVKSRGIEAPEEEEILQTEKDKKTAKQMLARLVIEGELVKLSPTTYLHKTVFDDAVTRVREHARTNGTIALAEFRDMYGTSRKYAVQVLDYMDQQRITRMEGDSRIVIG